MLGIDEAPYPVPMTGYTHAGVFHADDVFATALLKQIEPDFTVKRVFSVPEDVHGAIVYDIGGGMFDHHQADRELRDNGVPYAAFGKLWREYGHLVLDNEDDREAFDKSFIQPIDEVDNKGGTYPINQMVSDFNPLFDKSPESVDAAFDEAVQMASGILERRFEVIRQRRLDFDIVRDRMAECEPPVLVLDEWKSWQAAAVNSDFLYCVYPSNRGGYNVQGVPVSVGSGEVVRPLPEKWRGKSGDELADISDVKGLTFCHATGFLAACDTLESALEAVQVAEHEHVLEKMNAFLGDDDDQDTDDEGYAYEM